MGVGRKESHLAFRISTIGAMRVGFNKFSDRETIRRFGGRDPQVLAHDRISLGLKDGPGFKKGLDPVSSIFTADAGVFESSPGCLWIIGHAVDYDAPGPYL
jgi:hypothetical protein